MKNSDKHLHNHNHDHDHAHNHNHDHDHAHGAHQHGKNAPLRVLVIAILLTLGFACIELIGGLLSHSLALLGDAGHMFSDSLALLITAFAVWIARQPPTYQHSYGLGRAEVIAAWVSSLMMLLISIAVIAEAVDRIHNPLEVKATTVIIIASLGLATNGLIAWLLSSSERTLNMRAALLHVMGDVLGAFAALTAGVVIFKTGWYPIDPLLSIFIGILILITSMRLFRESLLVLMEGVPPHIEMVAVEQDLNSVTGVKTVHDLHIWTLSSGIIALSAHVFIHEMSSWDSILTQIRRLLKEKYHIDHVTLQPEPEIMDCQPCLEPGTNQQEHL